MTDRRSIWQISERAWCIRFIPSPFATATGTDLEICGAVSYTHLDVYKRQIWSNPEYAKLFPFTVPSQIHIRALGLNCGMYEIGLPKPGEKQEGACLLYTSVLHSLCRGCGGQKVQGGGGRPPDSGWYPDRFLLPDPLHGGR